MQTTDERCYDLAHDAMQYAKWIVHAPTPASLALRRAVSGQLVAEYANRIIAERTREQAAQDGAK